MVVPQHPACSNHIQDGGLAWTTWPCKAAPSWRHEACMRTPGRWDSNPPSASFGVPGRRHKGALTWSLSLPVVTARARREPRVPDAMRTQRGPSLSGARWKHGHAADGAAISALAIPLALVVLLRPPAMHMELAADPVDFVSEAGHGLLPLGRCHPLSARQCASCQQLSPGRPRR